MGWKISFNVKFLLVTSFQVDKSRTFAPQFEKEKQINYHAGYQKYSNYCPC